MIILSFVNALLLCAIVVFVAFVVVWGFKEVFSKDIDANVMKWGKIVVALICAAILLAWLLGALHLAPVTMPRIL